MSQPLRIWTAARIPAATLGPCVVWSKDRREDDEMGGEGR
jgi:hypothetical protein